MTVRLDFMNWCDKFLPGWDGAEQHPHVFSPFVDRRWIQFLRYYHEDEGKRLDIAGPSNEHQYVYRFKQATKALKLLSYPDRDVSLYAYTAVPSCWSTLWNPQHPMCNGTQTAVELLARSFGERVTP